jgi:transcriptional regulator with XRE-family HTH domain
MGESSARDAIGAAVWQHPEMRAALAQRDMATVLQRHQRVGISQRRIAAWTGQSQCEISELRAGRQVVAYDVLCRIADGLGVPRGWLGLAYDDVTASLLGTVSAHISPEANEQPEVQELLGHAAEVTVGGADYDIAKWWEPTAAAATPVPERIGIPDVEQIEAMTALMRALDYGSAAVPAETRWSRTFADRIDC